MLVKKTKGECRKFSIDGLERQFYKLQDSCESLKKTQIECCNSLEAFIRDAMSQRGERVWDLSYDGSFGYMCDYEEWYISKIAIGKDGKIYFGESDSEYDKIGTSRHCGWVALRYDSADFYDIVNRLYKEVRK